MDQSELKHALQTILRNALDNNGFHEDQKPPDTIYHYTNSAGLQGILENKYIWATNAYYLNDVSELKYGESLAKEILNPLIFSLSPSGSNHWVKKSEREITAPLEISSKYALLFEATQAVIRIPKNDVYVSSFSLEKNLLSQWRAYGNHGGGYSIGFDISGGVCRLKNGDEFGTFGVLYDEVKQRQVMGNFISDVIASFEKYQHLLEGTDWINRAELHLQRAPQHPDPGRGRDRLEIQGPRLFRGERVAILRHR